MFNYSVQKNKAYYADFDNLFYGMLGKIAEYDDKKFSELSNTAHLALGQNDFFEAKTYATAAAYFYGVPGLLLLNEVLVKDIQQMVNENEVVEQVVLNAMTYLLLAEILFKNDSNSAELMEKTLGNTRFNHDSFIPLKKQLVSFGELSDGQINECQETAHSIAMRCLEQLKSSTLKLK